MNPRPVNRACALASAAAILMAAGTAAGGPEAGIAPVPPRPEEKAVKWLINPRTASLDTARGSYAVGASASASCGHDRASDSGPDLTDWFLLREGVSVATPLREAEVPDAAAAGQGAVDLAGVVVGDDGLWTIEGTIKAPVIAGAWPCDLGTSRSRSHAYARVAATIAGVRYVDEISNVKTRQNVKGKGTGGDTKHARYKDPIMLRYLDQDSGALWEEELLRLEIAAGEGDFEWSWSDAGITLATPMSGAAPTGQIMITGGATSNWLVSPIGDFSAGLVDGVFTATGAWAGLAWELVYDAGKVVSAFLPPSAFNPELTLDYRPPPGELDPSATYDVTLDWGEDNVADAERVIPAPASLSLVFSAGLLLAPWRRR